MDKKAISSILGMDLSAMKEKTHELNSPVKQLTLSGGGLSAVWGRSEQTRMTVFAGSLEGCDLVQFSLKDGKLKLKGSKGLSINIGMGGVTMDMDIASNCGMVAGRDIVISGGSARVMGGRKGRTIHQQFNGTVGLVMDDNTPSVFQDWHGATIGTVVVKSVDDIARVNEKYAGATIGKVVVSDGWEFGGGSAVVVLESPVAPNIKIKGAGDMYYLGLEQDQLDIYIQGSGDVIASGGRVAELDVSLQGSGDVDFKECKAERCWVSLQGSGDVYVRASKLADVSVQGSGDVSVYGRPTEKRKSVQGTGSVEWV